MRKTLKRFFALFLCGLTLCSVCVIPVFAVDGVNGTNMIHRITMETGSDTAYVEITSESGMALYVALYDSESGQMLGVGVAEIVESVIRQEIPVTVSCKKDETTTVKAFLLDSTAFSPSCQSLTEEESETVSLTKKTVYSITAAEMLYSGEQVQAAVTVNADEQSELSVSFYADEELENISAENLHNPIATVSVETPEYCEMETLYLPVTLSLPEHFIILAELKDSSGNPVTDPYICVEYTSQYAQFREKTVEDVTAEYEGAVLNFDVDNTTNFGVLKTSVITVFVSSTENVLNVVESDPENADTDFIIPDFTYYFAYPDETVSSLQPGDCVYIDDTEYLFKVSNIYAADGVVVITPAGDAALTDFYDFLKVDLHEYDADDEGLLRFASAQASIGESVSESINWHPGGDDDITVSGELSLSNKTDIKIAFDINLLKGSYFEFSLKPTTTLTLKGFATAEKSSSDSSENEKTAKDELSVGKLKLSSPVPGLSVYIKPSLEVDLSLSGTVSVEFESKHTTGFTYTTKSGMHKADKKESSAKVDAEVKLELTIGPKIAVGVSFIDAVDASVIAQAGLKISLSESTDILTSEERDYHHACTLCLDGTAKWFLTADAKLKINLPGKNLDYNKSWNIVKFEGWIKLSNDTKDDASEEAGKFYISVLNAESSPFGGKLHIGSGSCPNKQWKTVFQAANTDDQALTGIRVDVTSQEGEEAFSGETEFFIYLYDGAYMATGTINGIDVRKEFKVDGEKQTVKLQEGRVRVYGNIADANTGAGIAGACVVAFAPGGSTAGQASANEFGNYELLLPSEITYTFKFSADSYTNKEEIRFVGGQTDFRVDASLKKAKCTVTFNANGGTTTVGTMTVDYGNSIGALPVATRDGYQFFEWNTSPDGFGMTVTADTAVVSDITVYARWRKDNTGLFTGLCHIVSSRNDSQAITVMDCSMDENYNIQMWDAAHLQEYTFIVEYVADGYYQIISSFSNKVITILGSNIVQATFTGSDDQLWRFVETGDKTAFYILSKSGLYISMSDSQPANHVNVIPGNMASDSWRLIPWLEE